MKTILLTGAAGFIGARTAELLLKSNIRVIAVDNMNNYYSQSLKKHRLNSLVKNKKFIFFKKDISNYKEMKLLFNRYQPSVIIDLAARAGVRYSLENPFIYSQTNCMGSLNLLFLAKEYKVRKYVLASSSSLYAGQKMPFLETLPVNEPISPYAATKKAAEVMAYTYHYLYGIDVSILRFFTVYGPAGRPDMSPFRFIQWIKEGKEIQLYGDGKQSRDFTYVDDIANGVIRATKRVGCEIINLGAGRPVSVIKMIRMMESLIGKKAKIKHLKEYKADMKKTWANTSKAEKLLGWKSNISFEEGLSKTVEWHLDNQKWLRRMPF